MTAVATVVPETRATGPRLAWLRDRGMGASILVAALSAAEDLPAHGEAVAVRLTARDGS